MNDFVVKNGLIVSESVDISGSLAQGARVIASGIHSHAQGNNTLASGQFSHAEGWFTSASGLTSHAEGDTTIASGTGTHAEGYFTVATGQYSHAEGFFTSASGQYAHVEGERTRATNTAAHAEGYATFASGLYSHAEGAFTTASAIAAHAEGWSTTGSAPFSHAEGHFTSTLATGSHTEGDRTTALGNYSHAEGSGSVAFGAHSHAEGLLTIASGSFQSVVGRFNSASSTPLWILGDGLSISNRKNLIAAYRDNLTVSGALEVTGALSVFLAGRTEFEVSSAGTRIGNLQTDNHLITGSVGITGSTFSVFPGGVNPEFQVVGNGTRIGNLQTDVHLLTGSFGITGSLNVVGGGITSSLLGTATRAISASAADTIPTALLRGEVHVSISGSDVTGNGSAVAPYRGILNAIISGSVTYGAGNYNLYVHPGVYSANVNIPVNTPLTIIGVQNPKGTKAFISGTLTVPTPFSDQRDVTLSNLKIKEVFIRDSNFSADGCEITTLTDRSTNSFGTFSSSIDNSFIGYYDANSSYKPFVYVRNSVVSSSYVEQGAVEAVNTEFYDFGSQGVNGTFHSCKFVENDPITAYGSMILSNCSVLDTTGSLQSITTTTLGYANSFLNTVNSTYNNFTGSNYSIVNAQQITGSLYANFANIIYVSSGSGDDDNDGTYLRPKKTVAGALAIATSGTKIKVGPGIYRESAGLSFGNIALEGDYWNVTTNPSTGPQVYISGSLVVSNNGYNEISNIKFNIGTGTANAATIVTNNCIILGNTQFFNTGNTLHNNTRFVGTYSTAITGTTSSFNGCTFGNIITSAAHNSSYVFNNCSINAIPSMFFLATGSMLFNNTNIRSTGNVASFTLANGVSHSFVNSSFLNLNGTPAKITGAGWVTFDDFNFDLAGSSFTNQTNILSAFDTISARQFTGFSTSATISSAAVTWSVAHNLNTSTPFVQVYAGSQMMIPASVRSVNSSSVEITFATATAGTAIVMRP